jgi:hypothetical protein
MARPDSAKLLESRRMTAMRLMARHVQVQARMKYLANLILLALPMGATPIYYLATDQTGAQTQIDVNHTSTWTLTPNSAFDFGGGIFVMKDGSNTSATVILSLYQGTDANGTLLGAVTLTHAAFCAQVGNCGQFGTHRFDFTVPVPLQVGVTYFAALTSSANDVQSQAYFIKNDFYFISDTNGVAVPVQPVTFGTPPPSSPSPVPEPGSMALILVGAGALAAKRRALEHVV